jgi:hypothetical protein
MATVGQLIDKKIADHEFTIVQVIKGRKLLTPRGEGTELAIEYNKKFSSIRVIVKLDDPSKWVPTERTPHPYMMLHDLKFTDGEPYTLPNN